MRRSASPARAAATWRWQAGEDGADYVAFGAFFPSGTKDVTRFIDPEILQWWSELMELPCCAIGGITAENCAPLVQAGADFLAVVWLHLEPSGRPRRRRARAETLAIAAKYGPAGSSIPAGARPAVPRM